ncbi:potassium-transporting ATPase subunit F [Aquicella siphonis]
MSVYSASAVIVLVLFIYLLFVIMKPELF